MRGCELCMHYDLLLLLSTSTKHYQKKKKNKSVKSSLAHWSSNVTTQLRSCWLKWHKGACALRWVQKLGMELISFWVWVRKWVLSLVVTLFFFYHHVSNLTLHMGQTRVSSPMFDLLYWKFYCMPFGRLGP